MAERVSKRPAGVTRIPDPEVPVEGEVLTSISLSDFLLADLQRVAADRGLDDSGTKADLEARITADFEGE